MLENLYLNWPVYLCVSGFVVFVVYAIIKSKQTEKKDQITPGQGEKKQQERQASQ